MTWDDQQRETEVRHKINISEDNTEDEDDIKQCDDELICQMSETQHILCSFMILNNSCHKLSFDAPSRSSIVWRAGVVHECKHKYSLIISSDTGIENTNKAAVNPEAACNNIIIFHCSLFTVIFIVFVSLQFVQLLLASSQSFAMMLNTSNSVLQYKVHK